MSRPKVLLLGTIDHAHAEWAALSKHADLITPTATDRAAFLAECTSGAFTNVLAAYRTFSSASITGPWDAELLSALPQTWRYLCHVGAGYDAIDVHACAARSPTLLVSNVPDPVNDATADTAIWLMLGALRGFNPCMTSLRAGRWRDTPAKPLGHDPQGKVLGILGMGGIGRNMARKAAAFGMSTIYHNRSPLPGDLADGAEYVGFEELLRRADVLSLNLPLNKNTRHIISREQFRLMKRSAVVVNTARGAVMDEAALVEALDQGLIAGAGLDVFEDEPRVHQGLLDNEKVMLLPHCGTYTFETMHKMEAWAIDNVRLALTEGRLKSPVPEHKNLRV
jgi:glyoxylate reductase